MSRQGKLAALASTGVTKAELDLLDGVTSTTAELNITDGVTSTAAELNILDGVTATAAEINLIDGGTARGTTAVADGDGFLTNDGGTMRMTKVDTLATYMGTKIGGGLEFIASTGAISNAASVQFREQDGYFDSTKYDSYVFKFYYVIPATDSVYPIAQLSANDGSAYDTTNGNYHYGDNTDFVGYYLSPVYNMGSAANEYGMCGEMELFAPHLSNYTYASVFTIMTSSSGTMVSSIHSADRHSQVHLSAAAQNAIKFSFNSGNIESGEIVMFGRVNS